jgi:hypothetical protein
MATGKKVATGTFNMLGKVTSSVAGVVGAKSVVGDGFSSVKKALGKSGLMSGVLSPFGDIDILDELRDQWTHDSKVSHPALQNIGLRIDIHPRISKGHTSSEHYKALLTTNRCG